MKKQLKGKGFPKIMIYEVCCGSTDDALMAWEGGADRIELNSAMFLGGLTPSLGSLRQVKRQTGFPVMAMVRPREGGFCYTDAEYATMLEDAQLFLENGADGLVFAFLNEDGTVDRRRTAEFVKLCGEKDAVFSRAIDVVPDMVEGTKILADLGLTRVLTSGGKPTAPEGADMIARMVEVAGSMQVLPGGGITAENAAELVKRSGVSQIHSAPRVLDYDPSTRHNPDIYYGGMIDGKFIPEDERWVTDPQEVARIKAVLSHL